MVDVSTEKKIKILERTLGHFFCNGDEHLFKCPKCEHHKNKLSVNLIKNVFKCWVCDWSGRNIYRIVRTYGEKSDKYEWKNLFDQVEIENFAAELFVEKNITKQQKIDLPGEFTSLANKNLPATSLYPINYLKSRNVDIQDIKKWKMGFCTSGRYAGRIVIPSFDLDGDVNYFVTRAYDNNWKKYLNPKISRDIIFNYPYIDFDEPVTLVEGVFDAIKAGDNSIPILGSTLSENSKLFNEIIKNDTPIYLALDPDAEKKTNRIISLFLKYDIQIYLVDINPYEDVGEMSKREFLNKKQTAVLLNSDNYLLSRIIRI